MAIDQTEDAKVQPVDSQWVLDDLSDMMANCWWLVLKTHQLTRHTRAMAEDSRSKLKFHQLQREHLHHVKDR